MGLECEGEGRGIKQWQPSLSLSLSLSTSIRYLNYDANDAAEVGGQLRSGWRP